MALCLILSMYAVILVGPTALTVWRVRGEPTELEDDRPTSVEDAARRAGL